MDAIGEILEHGRDGLVVRPASVPDLASAIRELALAPELRARLGKAARKKALDALAPQVEQANWTAIYQRLLPSIPELKRSVI